jgi:hypothetical protein
MEDTSSLNVTCGNDLSGLKVRISFLTSHLTFLSNSLESTIETRNRIQSHVDEIQSKITFLQGKRSTLSSKWMQKQQNANFIKSEIQTLEIKLREIAQIKNKALYSQNDEEGVVSSDKSKMASLKAKMHDLERNLKDIQSKTKMKPPEPKYEINNLYCMNGIYMCKNHPPQQVLVNGEEIKQYEANLKFYEGEEQKLMREFNKIKEAYEKLKAKLESDTDELQSATTQLQQIISQKNAQRLAIEEKQRLYIGVQNEAISLKDTLSNVTTQLTFINNEFSGLTSSLQQEDSSIDQLQQEKLHTEEQLNTLYEQYSQLQLTQHDQQLQEEKETRERFRLIQLEELAKQEIEAEQARNSSSPFLQRVTNDPSAKMMKNTFASEAKKIIEKATAEKLQEKISQTPASNFFSPALRGATTAMKTAQFVHKVEEEGMASAIAETFQNEVTGAATKATASLLGKALPFAVPEVAIAKSVEAFFTPIEVADGLRREGCMPPELKERAPRMSSMPDFQSVQPALLAQPFSSIPQPSGAVNYPVTDFFAPASTQLRALPSIPSNSKRPLSKIQH